MQQFHDSSNTINLKEKRKYAIYPLLSVLGVSPSESDSSHERFRFRLLPVPARTRNPSADVFTPLSVDSGDKNNPPGP